MQTTTQAIIINAIMWQVSADASAPPPANMRSTTITNIHIWDTMFNLKLHENSLNN